MQGWSVQFAWRCKLVALGLLLFINIVPSRVAGICGDAVTDGGEQCCPCDCTLDRLVTVDEIVTAVNIALGSAAVCESADCDRSGRVTVDEIISCINAALNGCPAAAASAEECDDGGLCVGGSNAGSACDDESDCVGNGACFGGVNDLRGCASDEDCAGAPCRWCRPYGGDGCAANCTLEVDDVCELAPCTEVCVGPIDGGSVAVVNPAILPPIPLPLVGSQVLTVGKAVDGSTPVVIKTTGVDLDRIAISTIACACVRGAEARTCGGTLFDRDGVQSVNCTPGFADAETCPQELPCAAVHGPGNTGSGFVGCGDPGVNVEVIQDCNGTRGAEPFDPIVLVSDAEGMPSATRGSAFVVFTSAIGTIVGLCTGTDPGYGPDQSFCTEDDPIANRGAPNSIAFTTNLASATVLNPADFEGDVLGPAETSGAPFTCADHTLSISGANLAGAFTACDQPTISDIAVTVNFVCE